MSLITLDDVTKIYPRGTRPALDDITLHIDRGDFVFLVGASGSGKTTLLSLLLREEEATGGEIRVAGNDLRRLTNRQVPQYRRSIGFVFQDYKLLNNKTVWQNVAFALEVIGTSRSTIRTLVPKVLQTVGLSGKEKNYPHELSGGEQQRVAIARAYVNHPQILLADEPTGNLDPTTSLGIMEVLDAINRTGTTIVMATHNEEIVNSMRKRVVELHNGKIVRDEQHGSYDSALYFPDRDVESKATNANALKASAHQDGSADEQKMAALDTKVDAAAGEDKDARFRPQRSASALGVAQSLMASENGDEGIARLAHSVHSGRTGRYGEVFQSVETTMTWGKGLSAEDIAAKREHEEAYAKRHGTNVDKHGGDVNDTDTDTDNVNDNINTGANVNTPDASVDDKAADPRADMRAADAPERKDSPAGPDRLPNAAQRRHDGASTTNTSATSAAAQAITAQATERPVSLGRPAAQEHQSDGLSSIPPAPPAPPTPPVPPQPRRTSEKGDSEHDGDRSSASVNARDTQAKDKQQS
ncbi:cell division ATP-binding protein FtsE [Bifidobacterium apri]|uniref:cell division ATP-binding protein FtsE n=1 Tax=Bifidobacterium apri TaxID=1769423 RepID=UPI003992702D